MLSMKICTVSLLVSFAKVVYTQVTCISPDAVVFNDKCFEVFSTPSSWHDAERYCSRFLERRALASVSSLSESYFLNSQKPKGSDKMWIGGNYNTHEGKWRWRDGTAANLSSLWSHFQPDNKGGIEYCLEILKDGKLNDNTCGSLRPFVCMDIPAKNCSLSEFQCDNGDGECANVSYRCNGYKDCIGGIDELGCAGNCSSSAFECNNTKCVHIRLQCNGDNDCGDNSDELNCAGKCSPETFECNNTKCVHIRLRCNGDNDCGDKSDELSCGCEGTKLDVVFVLLSRGFVYEDYKFMETVIKAFLILFGLDINNGNVRIGFQVDLKTLVRLNHNLTKIDVYKTWYDTVIDSDIFNTADVLKILRQVMFNKKYGDRGGVINVAIVVAGGDISDNDVIPKILEEAKQARDNGIHVYGIVTDQSVVEQFYNFVSRPVEEHVYFIQEFSIPKLVGHKVFSTICTEVTEENMMQKTSHHSTTVTVLAPKNTTIGNNTITIALTVTASIVIVFSILISYICYSRRVSEKRILNQSNVLNVEATIEQIDEEF